MVSRPRRLFMLLPIALLLAALALWALVFRSAGGPELVTATVKVGDVEEAVLATGKLRPKELVSVGAQVSGQVRRLHVSIGQVVRTGDPIAEIDDLPQRLSLRNAEAAVDSLRAQRAAREASLVQTELAFRRQETMLASDATARADFEAARSNPSLRRSLRLALRWNPHGPIWRTHGSSRQWTASSLP